MCHILPSPEHAAVLQAAGNSTVVVYGDILSEQYRGLHPGTSASVTQAAACMNFLQVTEI